MIEEVFSYNADKVHSATFILYLVFNYFKAQIFLSFVSHSCSIVLI